MIIFIIIIIGISVSPLLCYCGGAQVEKWIWSHSWVKLDIISNNYKNSACKKKFHNMCTYIAVYAIMTLCISRLLFVVYMAYLVCFTMSLGLASRSSDPREYSGRLDPLRLICEMASFLYLIITIVMECTLILL